MLRLQYIIALAQGIGGSLRRWQTREVKPVTVVPMEWMSAERPPHRYTGGNSPLEHPNPSWLRPYAIFAALNPPPHHKKRWIRCDPLFS